MTRCASRSLTVLPLALLLAVLALLAMPATGHAQGLAQSRVGASAVLAMARTGDFTPLAAVPQLDPAHGYDGNASASLLAAKEMGAVRSALASGLRAREGQLLEDMSASGGQASKGGLTRAGWEYQKHMGRGELPAVGGSELDSAGQGLLDDLLTNPNAEMRAVTRGNFAGGTRVAIPGGPGATFDASGVFQYFGIY